MKNHKTRTENKLVGRPTLSGCGSHLDKYERDFHFHEDPSKCKGYDTSNRTDSTRAFTDTRIRLGRVRKRHPRMFYRCLTHGTLIREKDRIPFGWCFRTHSSRSFHRQIVGEKANDELEDNLCPKSKKVLRWQFFGNTIR